MKYIFNMNMKYQFLFFSKKNLVISKYLFQKNIYSLDKSVKKIFSHCKRHYNVNKQNYKFYDLNDNVLFHTGNKKNIIYTIHNYIKQFFFYIKKLFFNKKNIHF